MLRIIMEPRKMGGYTSYFQHNPVVPLATRYSVQLRGFEPWAKDIMYLIRFKQIRGAFHPEAGYSQCGNKYHQLRYFTRKFNEKAKKYFIWTLINLVMKEAPLLEASFSFLAIQ